MLDERGRVFGRMNVVDLFILLLVLAVVAGGIYRATVMRPAVVGETATAKVLVEVDRVRSYTLERVRVGDLLRHHDSSIPFGTITDIVTGPATEMVPTSDGRIVKAEIPEHYRMLLTVEVPVTVTASALRAGGEDLKIGAQFLLKSKYARFSGTVLEIDDAGVDG